MFWKVNINHKSKEGSDVSEALWLAVLQELKPVTTNQWDQEASKVAKSHADSHVGKIDHVADDPGVSN